MIVDEINTDAAPGPVRYSPATKTTGIKVETSRGSGTFGSHRSLLVAGGLVSLKGQTQMRRSVTFTVVDWSRKLNSLAELKANWNSYSAPAPSLLAIDNARALIGEATAQHQTPDRVEPSAMGGVGVTFASGAHEVTIELYNKGTAHALFVDESTGNMDTDAVSTDREGYRKILGRVGQFLHGK